MLFTTSAQALAVLALTSMAHSQKCPCSDGDLTPVTAAVVLEDSHVTQAVILKGSPDTQAVVTGSTPVTQAVVPRNAPGTRTITNTFTLHRTGTTVVVTPPPLITTTILEPQDWPQVETTIIFGNPDQSPPPSVTTVIDVPKSTPKTTPKSGSSVISVNSAAVAGAAVLTAALLL